MKPETDVRGEAYELFICALLDKFGEHHDRVVGREEQLRVGADTYQLLEIKLDERWDGAGGQPATGRLWLETSEKRAAENSRWVLSGIYREGHREYLIGSYAAFWIFDSEVLRFRAPRYEELRIKTSVGYVMPLSEANEYAKRKFRIVGGHWYRFINGQEALGPAVDFWPGRKM